MALATANAATLKANLNGVVSSTYDSGSTTITTEQGLSTALASLDFTTNVDYSTIETTHIDSPGGLDSSAASADYEWKTCLLNTTGGPLTPFGRPTSTRPR